jgi:hypothetical protein
MPSDVDWQELAAQGHAVEAIRAYCAVRGVGLAEAKAAVERWRAVNYPPSPAFQRAFRVARRLTDRLITYLGGAEPRSFQVRILPADPNDVVGQNTRFFSDILPDRPKLDLAVEIAMAGVPAELREQVALDHLDHGARMVWVIESDQPTAHIHTDRVTHLLFSDDAVFDGGEVLPGFLCKVSDLFA